MKKFITLFLLIIVVHMTNGNVVEFPKGTSYFYHTDWGKVTSITIYKQVKKSTKMGTVTYNEVIAEFSGHAVDYIEEK